MARNYKSELNEMFWAVSCPPGEKKRRPKAGDFKKMLAHIGSLPEDELILKMFREVGEDHRDPWSWYRLMGLIAETIFQTRKIGRAPKHRRPKNAVLRRDFYSIVKMFPKFKGADLCREMSSKFPGKYGAVPNATLLRWLSDDDISIVAAKHSLKAKTVRPSGAKKRKR